MQSPGSASPEGANRRLAAVAVALAVSLTGLAAWSHFENRARTERVAHSAVPPGGVGLRPRPTETGGVQDGGSVKATPVLLASIYSKRTLAGRWRWIEQSGGSPQSEQAVATGLEWLARHQANDGAWTSHCLHSGPARKCDLRAPCSGPGGDYDMALTGLALLAFQAGGHYAFNSSQYSATVRKGLGWLLAHQRPDGGLLRSSFTGGSPFYQQFMYEHGIATFALAEACAVARAEGQLPSESQIQAMRWAIRFLYRMQHADGGWRYTDRVADPSDTSVTGWQVLALKSAKEAGEPLETGCLKRLQAFLEAQVRPDGRTGYQGPSLITEATTGVGMLGRQFLLDQPQSPLVGRAAAALADYIEGPVERRLLARRTPQKDFYLWYNGSLAMFQVGGESWRRWNAVVRDTIVGLQEQTGCARGSWAPDDQWGDQGGRIYSTALAALTLEVYYRYVDLDEVRPSGDPHAPQYPGSLTGRSGPTPPLGHP